MGVMKNIKNSFKRWMQYQNTVRELSSLDNRSLSDLGISRADIKAIAMEQKNYIM